MHGATFPDTAWSTNTTETVNPNPNEEPLDSGSSIGDQHSQWIEGDYPPLIEGDSYRVSFQVTATNAVPDRLLEVLLHETVNPYTYLERTVHTSHGQLLGPDRDNRGLDAGPVLVCSDTEETICTAEFTLQIKATAAVTEGGTWSITVHLRAQGAGNDLPDGAMIEIHTTDS